MTYVNVDIDIDDVLSGLSEREIQKLVDDLYEDGYYQTKLQSHLDEYDGTPSLNEQLFRTELNKIRANYFNLASAEEELILKIAKRY
jgi:hypothetical protein